MGGEKKFLEHFIQQAAGPIGEFMSTKGKFKEGFHAMNMDPNEPNVHYLLTRLTAMIEYLFERRTHEQSLITGLSDEEEVLIAKPSYIVQAFKKESTNFIAMGKPENLGYMKFPDHKSIHFINAYKKFGVMEPAVSNDSAESESISAGLKLR